MTGPSAGKGNPKVPLSPGKKGTATLTVNAEVQPAGRAAVVSEGGDAPWEDRKRAKHAPAAAAAAAAAADPEVICLLSDDEVEPPPPPKPAAKPSSAPAAAAAAVSGPLVSFEEAGRAMRAFHQKGDASCKDTRPCEARGLAVVMLAQWAKCSPNAAARWLVCERTTAAERAQVKAVFLADIKLAKISEFLGAGGAGVRDRRLNELYGE